MIDGIMLRVGRNLWDVIKDRHHGAKRIELDSRREGVVAYEVYKLENFDIKVYNHSIVISGSIHSFHNRINNISEDNRDDFSYEDFCQAVKRLEQMIGFDLRYVNLIQLEIGVNLKVDFHVKDFLRQNVLMWNFEGPIWDRNKRGKGHFKEFETSQFYVKTYDKGRQLELGYEELRLEFKYIKPSYYRGLGIHTLADLMERPKFQILARDLFQRFDKDLLIVDTVDMSFIKVIKDRELLMNGMLQAYWEQLPTELSRFSKLKKPIHPMTVSRRKSSFLRLLEVYDLTNRKAHVMALLRDKIYELSDVDVTVNLKVRKYSLITRLK